MPFSRSCVVMRHAQRAHRLRPDLRSRGAGRHCGRAGRAGRSRAARKPLVCGKDVAHVAAAPKGDPETRRAAQRGLAFLASASQAWTQQHNCFGCHVQAVTVEAFAVGKHHRYDVPARDVDGMVKALLMGVTAGGRTTGAAFEGQAWARYDQWIDGQRSSELLKYADAASSRCSSRTVRSPTTTRGCRSPAA